VIEEVRAGDALAALAPDWWALWERCPSASPFRTPAWLVAWWGAFAHGTLLALAARDGGQLSALLPLYVERVAGGARRLSLLGTGVSDYMGALVAPGADDALDALLAHAAGRADLWDVAEFEQLAPGEPLARARWPWPAHDRLEVQEACPVAPLPGDADEFLARLPPRFRSRITGRYPRRLGGIGELEHVVAGPDDVDGTVADLCRLHTARRAARGLDTPLASPDMQGFLQRAAAGFAARGLLRLHALRLSGRRIGVVMVFAARKRACAYLGAFAPEFENYSPGVLLLWYAIRTAIEDGALEFDFLRGREPYKSDGGAADRLNVRRVLRCRVAVSGSSSARGA
jgi:CelD/BcsL family acetyltransferase involved in cellulose biosynthesis